MKTRWLQADRPNAVAHAIDIIQNGGMVAFPTDTVYGLGALAFQSDSIHPLYTAKGQMHNRALALLLGSPQDLPLVSSRLAPEAHALAEAFWPGALTLVVPRGSKIPRALTPLPTIGVRMPDHPIALEILQACGPLAVSTANRTGEPAPNTAGGVRRQLDGRIHLILDGGKCPGGQPSTVVDCTAPGFPILRTGPITEKQIQSILEK